MGGWRTVGCEGVKSAGGIRNDGSIWNDGRDRLRGARRTNERRQVMRRPAWMTMLDHGDNEPQTSVDLQRAMGQHESELPCSQYTRILERVLQYRLLDDREYWLNVGRISCLHET